MFWELFAKEWIQTVKSIPFLLYTAILAFFFVTQLGTFSPLEKPEPGQESYGLTYSSEKSDIMAAALGALAKETESESFTTYPVGFYKNVKPGQEKLERIRRILEEAAGITWEQILEEMKEQQSLEEKRAAGGKAGVVYGGGIKLPASESLTYERFLELMKETDKLLGGGSSYAPDSVSRLAVMPADYEDALGRYRDIVEKDRVTGAYAREFSDYMGLMAGILPVFLAVSRSLKDRRAKACGVIWVRQASSGKLVLSRYLAAVAAAVLPVLLLGISVHLQSSYCARTLGVRPDSLAFLKYVGGWILPTILFTLSVGFLLTEMINSPLMVLVQGAVWFAAVMMGAGGGNLEYAGMNYIPRWNSFGLTGEFFRQLPELIRNRLFYTLAAVLMLGLTALVFDLKRKGVWRIGGNLFGNRKSTS